MHQDAQEFMNFLLDTLLESVSALEKQREQRLSQSTNGTASVSAGSGGTASRAGSTFVHQLFCGKTVSQTRCMNCENSTKMEQSFMELTLEIEHRDTTLERCLTAFR